MKSFRLTTIRALQILLLIISAVYNFNIFKGTKLFGNAASRILLAVGPMLGIGSPYKDLYEIVPPGYLIFIASWARIFGMSMISFKFIQVILILLNGFFLIKVLEKLFQNKFLQFFVFFSIVITVYSRIVQTDFFSIDLFATTLILGGLVVLFYAKNIFFRIPATVALFVLASQMKDIYILSLASLLPFYLREFLKKDKRDFWKLMLTSTIGPLVIFVIIVAYLVANDAILAYLNILTDKYGYAQTFSPKIIILSYLFMTKVMSKSFLISPYLIIGLLIANAMILTKTIKKEWLTLKKLTFSQTIRKIFKLIEIQLQQYGESLLGKIMLVSILIIFLLYGMAIYGLFHGTQLTMVITSFYILIGFLLIWPVQLISKLKSSLLRIGLMILLFLLFIPRQSVFNYKYFPVKRDFTFEVEKAIIQRVNKEECILHVHGWEVAPSYINTQRRPCSKYFLSNELFNIDRSNVIDEYRNDLLNNPPSAIIYNEKGGDMDIEKFNNQVVNFNKILQKCYVADPKFTNYMDHFFAEMTLYWPITDLDEKQLESCWLENID